MPSWAGQRAERAVGNDVPLTFRGAAGQDGPGLRYEAYCLLRCSRLAGGGAAEQLNAAIFIRRSDIREEQRGAKH